MAVCLAFVSIVTVVGTATAANLSAVDSGASSVRLSSDWLAAYMPGVLAQVMLARVATFLGFAWQHVAYLYTFLQRIESLALVVFGVIFLGAAALVRRVPSKA